MIISVYASITNKYNNIKLTKMGRSYKRDKDLKRWSRRRINTTKRRSRDACITSSKQIIELLDTAVHHYSDADGNGDSDGYYSCPCAPYKSIYEAILELEEALVTDKYNDDTIIKLFIALANYEKRIGKPVIIVPEHGRVIKGQIYPSCNLADECTAYMYTNTVPLWSTKPLSWWSILQNKPK
jgi:hypothetical protein